MRLPEPVVRHRSLTASLFALFALGIAQPVEGQATVTRGPAGEEVVFSARPLDSRPGAWRVDAAPSLVIGDEMGADSTRLFGLIVSATRLLDGRIAIADRAAYTIRIFDRTGNHLRSVGRRGQGPGEFSNLLTFRQGPGGTLLASDNNGSRTAIFSADGTLIRAIVLATRGGSIEGVFGDGAMVSTSMVFTAGPVPDPPPGGLVRTSRSVLNPDGTLRDSIRELPATIMTPTSVTPTPLVFGPRGMGAAHDSTFYWGFPATYEINAFSPTGKLRRVIRRQWTPVPVTREQENAYREERLGRQYGLSTANMHRIINESRFAESHPAFSALLADSEGYLWVREHRPVTPPPASPDTRPWSWSVFDPRGRWLADVAVPPGLEVLEIGADYILGTGKTANDAAQVRVHRLIR